jgi:hypothetical protein
MVRTWKPRGPRARELCRDGRAVGVTAGCRFVSLSGACNGLAGFWDYIAEYVAGLRILDDR